MTSLVELFRTRATHLFWQPLAAEHVWETSAQGDLKAGAAGQEIRPDESYFAVRLKEMYLADTRKLWRKFYPMLHSFTRSAGREENAVAGPGQLRELGLAGLEHAMQLNYRLAGPTVFKGGDLRVLVGLYALPGADAARALIDTVGAIANLGGFALGQSAEIANTVKAGIERIVGLDDATLQLGIDYTFAGAVPLLSCYHVGIAAPSASVDPGKLWLRDGRLYLGDDPVVARPFDRSDYLVLGVERVDTYTDWPSLPGMAEIQNKLASAFMSDSVDRIRERVRALWPEFQVLIDGSPYLSRPDRLRIAGDVAQELRRRLARQDPFSPRPELRSTASGDDGAAFDLADVPSRVDPGTPTGLLLAEQALARDIELFTGN